MPIPSLIVADSERSADLLYAARFFAPDPFLFLESKGRKVIMLSDLEIDRGRREAQVDEIIALSEVKSRHPHPDPPFSEIVAQFLRERRIRRVRVPYDFSAGLALALQSAGIRIEPAKKAFWPAREFKTAPEIKALSRALRITETGMARGLEVLAAAEIRGRHLHWSGKKLTSERLRAEIDSAILRVGGTPANTIVAGGLQACDPHERGSGLLHANDLIILDIFPRDTRSGYFGDMTRTIVRGRASEAQRRLWHTVQKGQRMAFAGMKPGASGETLHEKVKAFFTGEGYPTERREGRWIGFFHGTGHGLGLEIHEQPRFSQTRFLPGQVITVEPGLYWPGTGGVRIEDVALITETGVRKLSRFPQVLEI